MSEMDAERLRIRETDAGLANWRRWGPYLSERAGGSVREDYSADGDAWASFPFDAARSRTYRWNEDGLAGFCDSDQTWCLALALWNGNDPILKERLFGLTNSLVIFGGMIMGLLTDFTTSIFERIPDLVR